MTIASAVSPGPVSRRAGCPICGRRAVIEHRVLWQDGDLHVVWVDEPGQPCFFRVIWNDHVAETSDLDARGRAHLWRVLMALESAVIDAIGPDKINLASLGNRVPHLHWHLIGRWADDPQFPDSVWSPPMRDVDPALHRVRRDRVEAALPHLVRALVDATGR